MSRRKLCPGVLVMVLVVFSSFAAPQARAAFVNGIEHFDGTSYDLNTWEGHYTLGTQIQWNGAMIFDTRTIPNVQGGGRGEMVTVQPLVGVGQWVEAEVTLSGATDISPQASLRLSTKTHPNNSNLDSYSVETSLLPHFHGINATQTQSGNGFG